MAFHRLAKTMSIANSSNLSHVPISDSWCAYIDWRLFSNVYLAPVLSAGQVWWQYLECVKHCRNLYLLKAGGGWPRKIHYQPTNPYLRRTYSCRPRVCHCSESIESLIYFLLREMFHSKTILDQEIWQRDYDVVPPARPVDVALHYERAKLMCRHSGAYNYLSRRTRLRSSHGRSDVARYREVNQEVLGFSFRQ